MLHPLRTPTVTPRRLFFFFILANCTDIQVLDLEVDIGWERWEKCFKSGQLQLFSCFTIPGMTVLIHEFVDFSLKHPDAHWGHYGLYLHGSLIIESSYADKPVKDSDKKLLLRVQEIEILIVATNDSLS